MKVSISKSVGRTFEVLESFRDAKKPVSATEVRRRLGHPHSSIAAVLHNLVELGYLSYDNAHRRYFPTHKLHQLGIWVQTALIGQSGFHDLAQAIAMETNETTAITSRSFIFLNIVHVQRGSHPMALQFPVGIGVSLFRSTPGLVVVSQMTDPEIERLVRYSNRWAEKAKADQTADAEEVMATVAEIRENGHLIGLDTSLEGIGAVSYPLPSPFDGNPLAISVTGPTQRIRAQTSMIRQVIEHYLQLHASGITPVIPRRPRSRANGLSLVQTRPANYHATPQRRSGRL